MSSCAYAGTILHCSLNSPLSLNILELAVQILKYLPIAQQVTCFYYKLNLEFLDTVDILRFFFKYMIRKQDVSAYFWSSRYFYMKYMSLGSVI